MFTIIIAGALFVIILGWLMVSYSFLIPPKKGLPILMYHKVSENRSDGLTVAVEKLEEQFHYLCENGYRAIFFGELLSIVESGQKLPPKTLIITFDDAYESFSTHALPLIEKYGLKATVFIPVAYMGKVNTWDQGNDPIMSAEKMAEIHKSQQVEFGLHSFFHSNYREMALEDIREDLLKCFSTLKLHNLPFIPVVAYPYGGYPRKDKVLLDRMKVLFRDLNLDFALRIGNRINPVPCRDPYELKRIDIKGTDSFCTFRIKLRKGRKKLF